MIGVSSTMCEMVTEYYEFPLPPGLPLDLYRTVHFEWTF